MKAPEHLNQTLEQYRNSIGRSRRKLVERLEANTCEKSPDGLHEYDLRADVSEAGLRCTHCGDLL